MFFIELGPRTSSMGNERNEFITPFILISTWISFALGRVYYYYILTEIIQTYHSLFILGPIGPRIQTYHSLVILGPMDRGSRLTTLSSSLALWAEDPAYLISGTA
jgi:hypothetical protein